MTLDPKLEAVLAKLTPEQLAAAQRAVASLTRQTPPPPTPKSSTTFYSREAEILADDAHQLQVKVHHVVAHALAQFSDTNWDGDLATLSLSTDPLDGALCVEVTFWFYNSDSKVVVFALEMNRLTVRKPNG